MDLFLIVACGLVIVLQLVELSRATLTGRMGFGKGAVSRADDPDKFWASAVLAALSIPVLSWLLLRSSQGDTPGPGDLNPLQLLLAAGLALLLARFLLRGIANIAGTPFSQEEEPTQYWLLVAFTFAALVVTTWIALGFPLLL
jgi:hypothetical protein